MKKKICLAFLFTFSVFALAVVFVSQVYAQSASGSPVLPSPVPNQTWADLNADSRVNLPDVTSVLAKWGQQCNGCLEDLNMDGTVNLPDVVFVLNYWGNDVILPRDTFDQIQVGQTTYNQVITLLGQPVKEEELENGNLRLTYNSDQEIFPMSVTIDSATNKAASVFYVVNINDFLRLRQFIARYGQPQAQRYTTFKQWVDCFIWPDQGIAVWADSQGEGLDNIYFVRYFESMSLEQFLQLYGQGMSVENPYTM